MGRRGHYKARVPGAGGRGFTPSGMGRKANFSRPKDRPTRELLARSLEVDRTASKAAELTSLRNRLKAFEKMAKFPGATRAIFDKAQRIRNQIRGFERKGELTIDSELVRRRKKIYDQLASLRSQRERLIAESGPEAPGVMNLNQRIEALVKQRDAL